MLLNPFVSFFLKLVLFYHFYIFTLNILDVDSFYWSGTNSGSSRFIKIQKTKCNSKFLPLLLNNGHHRCRNNLCVTKYSKLTQNFSNSLLFLSNLLKLRVLCLYFWGIILLILRHVAYNLPSNINCLEICEHENCKIRIITWKNCLVIDSL